MRESFAVAHFNFFIFNGICNLDGLQFWVNIIVWLYFLKISVFIFYDHYIEELEMATAILLSILEYIYLKQNLNG